MNALKRKVDEGTLDIHGSIAKMEAKLQKEFQDKQQALETKLNQQHAEILQLLKKGGAKEEVPSFGEIKDRPLLVGGDFGDRPRILMGGDFSEIPDRPRNVPVSE
jgi:hypothetical protein